MTPSEAIESIAYKAKEAPEPYLTWNKAATLYWAANQLWNDEYSAWRAACDSLGFSSGTAECAWQRCSVYGDFCGILLKAIC